MFVELTQEQIAKLEAEKGPVYRAETAQGPVYVRVPTGAEMDMFGELREKSFRRAQTNLTKQCLVYPPWADFEVLLNRFCMLAVEPASLLIEISKGSEDSRASKSASEAASG